MECYSKAGVLMRTAISPVVFTVITCLDSMFVCLGEDECFYYMSEELEIVEKESMNACCLQIDGDKQCIRVADVGNVFYYCERST